MQKGDAMDAAERSERIPDIVIITGMSGLQSFHFNLNSKFMGR